MSEKKKIIKGCGDVLGCYCAPQQRMHVSRMCVIMKVLYSLIKSNSAPDSFYRRGERSGSAISITVVIV